MADPGDVRAVYEAKAQAYDAQRQALIGEETWLTRFAAHVPSTGAVLDLGIGTGRPIGAWLIAQGFALTGIDLAAAMVEIAQRNLPTARILKRDMTRLSLDQQFDGILSWNGFFHLPPDRQPAALTRICAHLAPGAPLLLTVGPQAGEVTGTVDGMAVYHASLAPDHYAELLAAEGVDVLDFVPEDPACGQHSVLLARKAPEPGAP